MKRLAFGIEYDGTNYKGWQNQKHTHQTVQSRIESAISKVADKSIDIVCAGRTDSGVHALEQVVHCDITVDRPLHGWVMGCNANLPADIRVLWAQYVDDSFNARFSAHKRKYVYLINCGKVKSALFRNSFTWCYTSLNIEAMLGAKEYWLGEQDFTSFRASQCQSVSPVRKVYAIEIIRAGDLIIISVEANSFLHHMVRNMVGVLMQIGLMKQDVDFARRVLLAKDRREASITAPASGLYLQKIYYPDNFNLQQRSPSWICEYLRCNNELAEEIYTV